MNDKLSANVISIVEDTFNPNVPPRVIHFDLDNDAPEKFFPYINKSSVLLDAYIEKMEDRARKNKKNNSTDKIE